MNEDLSQLIGAIEDVTNRLGKMEQLISNQDFHTFVNKEFRPNTAFYVKETPNESVLRNRSYTDSDLWEQLLELLRAQLTKPSFRHWFLDVIDTHLEDEQFIVICPNQAHCDWLSTRYEELIEKAISFLVGYKISVKFKINDEIMDRFLVISK